MAATNKKKAAPRSEESLRRHYDIECDIANRLRNSTGEQRHTQNFYSRLYDELFHLVPDHPQLARKEQPEDQARRTSRQMRLLGSLIKPGNTFLEIGPGDCDLAVTVAKIAKRVYAVDVSLEATRLKAVPSNLTIIISTGTKLEIPPHCADLAYSNQLIEHLHPEDVPAHLSQVYAALAADGVYVCRTPHRLSGPHDITEHFADEPRGLHLREYDYAEVVEKFKRAGFKRVTVWASVLGRFYRFPYFGARLLESTIGLLPRRLQRVVSKIRPFRCLLQEIVIMGEK